MPENEASTVARYPSGDIAAPIRKSFLKARANVRQLPPEQGKVYADVADHLIAALNLLDNETEAQRLLGAWEAQADELVPKEKP